MSESDALGCPSDALVFPADTSQAGWRCLDSDEEIRDLGGFDPERLRVLNETQRRLCAGSPFGIFIVRHGLMVAELTSDDCVWGTRFDIYSCTKSFTSLAWGLLLDDQRSAGQGAVSLSSPIYEMMPQLGPLTDPRKERITLEHVLSMTSGMAGEDTGVWGCVTDSTHGPYEFALGLEPNRYGRSVGTLAADPGTRWDYSDPGYIHLGVAFRHVAGREMADFLEERIFQRIGMGSVSWDPVGGEGHIGPHTAATNGVHITGRDLARAGLLLLRKGAWRGTAIVPAWWIDLATRPSQAFNPAYGLGFWTNQKLAYLPTAPADMFLMAGYRANRCYVVPSLDLVVARVGQGPVTWDEKVVIQSVIDAIV
jgi:CubicO group peptidase (beta-lactamase class C family)